MTEVEGRAALSAIAPTDVNGRRRSRKTSERIAHDLATSITEGRLQPGTVLPTEKDMVELFGVGRSTLREALRLLETRGVLTIRSGPNGGPVVRRPRADDLGSALTLLLQFEGATFADVLVARRTFEPMLAQLAASRITDEQIAILQRTVDEMDADLVDQHRFLHLNSLFHATIAEASGSVVLRVFQESLKSVADGASLGVQYSRGRQRLVAEVHQRIIDRLAAHDEEGARLEMEKHLEDAYRFLQTKQGEGLSAHVRWTQ
jgi:DNA-binding FadR family transcriptional regulator